MADQDTTVQVQNGENVNDKLETASAEDEKIEDQHQEDTGTDTGKEDVKSDSEDDDTKGDGKTEEEDENKFQKRFTQLKGESLEEYVKNLEEAYANSSTEGQRNAQRAKDADERFQKVAELVAKDPEFAAKLAIATDKDAPSPVVDPALVWAKDEMERQYKTDWSTFSDSHPELLTDKDMQEAIINELDAITYAHEKRGVRLSMLDGLKKAWTSLGYSDSDKKEDVVNKTKEQASKSAPKTSTKSKGQKPEFTDDQIAVAKKMGLTPEQLAKYYK